MADDRGVHTVTEVIVCHVGGQLHRVCKKCSNCFKRVVDRAGLISIVCEGAQSLQNHTQQSECIHHQWTWTDRWINLTPTSPHHQILNIIIL